MTGHDHEPIIDAIVIDEEITVPRQELTIYEPAVEAELVDPMVPPAEHTQQRQPYRKTSMSDRLEKLDKETDAALAKQDDATARALARSFLITPPRS